MRLSTSGLLFLGLTLSCLRVKGDTEILNFHLPLPVPLDAAGSSNNTWPAVNLEPSFRETITLSSTRAEQWFTFDPIALQESGYKGWTIRVSWPGSSPTRITIIHPSSDGQFAVRAAPLSPPFPHASIQHINSYLPSRMQEWIAPLLPTSQNQYNDTRRVKEAHQFQTTLHVSLEPLALGIIPQTALSTIVLIILFAAVAGFCVPRIIAFLEWAVNMVSLESENDRFKGE